MPQDTISRKDINNDFYKFDIPFSGTIPASISNYNFSSTSAGNNIAFWLAHIQRIPDKDNTFVLKFFRGEFGKNDYLVSVATINQVVANTPEDSDVVWIPSNRTTEDAQTNTFYSVMKLQVINNESWTRLQGIVSHPTLSWSLLKSDIEATLLDFFHTRLNVDSTDVVSFGLSRVFSDRVSEQSENIPPQWIEFFQKKNIHEFAEFFWFDISERLVESQENGENEEVIEFSVHINQGNSQIAYRRLNLVKSDEMEKLSIHTPYGTIINGKFRHWQTISVDLVNGHLRDHQKESFIRSTERKLEAIFDEIFSVLENSTTKE